MVIAVAVTHVAAAHVAIAIVIAVAHVAIAVAVAANRKELKSGRVKIPPVFLGV